MYNAHNLRAEKRIGRTHAEQGRRHGRGARSPVGEGLPPPSGNLGILLDGSILLVPATAAAAPYTRLREFDNAVYNYQ